jgi:hypothetical protein
VSDSVLRLTQLTSRMGGREAETCVPSRFVGVELGIVRHGVVGKASEALFQRGGGKTVIYDPLLERLKARTGETNWHSWKNAEF